MITSGNDVRVALRDEARGFVVDEVPCSMERTPNSTQRATALAGWQCADA